MIPTTLFSIHKRVLSADASELGRYLPREGTSTIKLRSQRTQAVKEFRLFNAHMDGEGDITHWEFHPVDEALARSGVKVMIWND